MEIIVIREPGDREADPIIDALLTTEEVGVSRGRAFLDEHSTYKQNESVEITYRTGLRCGQLIEVIDSLQGETWRGKVVGIRHRYSTLPRQVGLYTSLDIERRIPA